MHFNSFDFAIFLPTVFFLYWFVTKGRKRPQNVLLVIASYVFYGWWDWRFLSLILLSTLVDFLVGLRLSKASKVIKRKLLLAVSITVNIGLLGLFKYYNFFIDSFESAFLFFGKEINTNSLNIVLPVGISFYTFQTLSYTIDVYRKKLESTHDFISFAAYVSFFPQLVAGPIERATNLLPQFSRHRTFDYTKAVDGLRQILWGLFKKVVIADGCAEIANQIFHNPGEFGGSTLFLGAVFFSFQIYGDFSGYSDIAIGTARLFGFDLRQNFAYPYFSRDIAEFWRRWHISLSSWFRDYVYIPLGGSRGGIWMKIRNTFIIFIVSGLWHGANWTFIIWGGFNAVLFLPLMLSSNNRKHLGVVSEGRVWPSFREFIGILSTFGLVTFGWIFFRARDLNHALQYIGGIFSRSLFSLPSFDGRRMALRLLILIVIFLIIEWKGRDQKYAIAEIGKSWKRGWRYAFYYSIIVSLYWFSGTAQEFIYFQF